jgi:hypothetical protein
MNVKNALIVRPVLQFSYKREAHPVRGGLKGIQWSHLSCELIPILSFIS